MFGLPSSPEVRAKARQVVKLQRVKHADSGQEGTIEKTLANGWLKVKWDHRTKASIIDPDQVKMINSSTKKRAANTAQPARKKNNLLGRVTSGAKRAQARRRARRAYGKELKAQQKLRSARARRVSAERSAFAVNGVLTSARALVKQGKTEQQAVAIALRKANLGRQVNPFNKLARETNMHPLDLLAKGTTGVLGFLEIHKRLKPGQKRKAAAKRQPAGKRRKNTASTTKLYREFQGRDPQGRVLSLHTPQGTPKDVSLIGPLIELRLKNRPTEPIKFGPSDRAALRNPQAYLGQAQRGGHRRLYIGLVKPYGRLKNGAPIDRAINLGEVASIAYWASKPHLLDHDRMVPWEHKCGDRGGRLPNLWLRPSGLLDIRYGDYTIRAEGIDN